MIMTLAGIVLGLLLATMGFGLWSLLRWHARAPVPKARVTAHIVLQLAALGLWIGFLATESLVIAWLAWAVITAGQVFGDLLMYASFRARHPDARGFGYLTPAGDALSFRRPAASLHAIVGALGWFSMLAVCILATIGG